MSNRLLIPLLLALSICPACDDSEAALAGAIVAEPTPDTYFTEILHPAQAAVPTGDPLAPSFDGDHWVLGTSSRPLRYPLQLRVGDFIQSFRVYLQRSNIAANASAKLQCLASSSHARHVDLTLPVTAPSFFPGPVVLELAIPDSVVTATCAMSILVTGSGIAGDKAGVATVSLVRPGSSGEPPSSALN
jgi:hypothetical protein